MTFPSPPLDMEYLVLNEHGEVVPFKVSSLDDIADWAELHAKQHTIAFDVRGQFEISTIFFGFDYGMGLRPMKMHFETMLFAREGHALDRLQWRCATLAEAKANHHKALQLVQLARKGPRKIKKAIPKVYNIWSRLMLHQRKLTKSEVQLLVWLNRAR